MVQVVPPTRKNRDIGTEVVIEPDADAGLVDRSSAQGQHVRLVASTRINARTCHADPVILGGIRENLAPLLDL